MIYCNSNPCPASSALPVSRASCLASMQKILPRFHRPAVVALTASMVLCGCRQQQADAEADGDPDFQSAPQSEPPDYKLPTPTPTNNMHTESWQQITSTLGTTLSQLKDKDVEVSELEFFDPAPAAEIDELEREMGIKLPESFRQFLAITGGFRFDWFTESSPIDHIEYGGNAEVDFLRGAEELTLAEAYREFQEHYDGFEVEDEAQVALVRRCFPLYLTDGAGNALAVRLDTDPLQIHLLKSWSCWHVSSGSADEEKSLVGLGLAEFLLHWASLGGPATENLLELVEEFGEQTLDANSAGGRAIREWLASPN